MEFKNTKTQKNLRDALIGESLARNKYTFFAMIARQQGEEDIAKAFDEMAKNEMMHAKFWFEQLYGRGESVANCLKTAAKGEYDEWHDMYPRFAEEARREGFGDLGAMFEKVAEIERSHEQRFMTMLAELMSKQGEAPAPAPKEKKKGYRCQFCGAIFENRPDVCDVCEAIGAFEEVMYEV